MSRRSVSLDCSCLGPGGHTFDQLGPIDAGRRGRRGGGPVPLFEFDYGGGDKDHPNIVHVTLDNSTGMQARVERHLDKLGRSTVDATITCPPIVTNASIVDTRELAQT